MDFLIRTTFFLSFSFITGQELLYSQNGKCSSKNSDYKSLLGMDVKVTQMYENNVKLHSDIMRANKDMKTALEGVIEKTEEQQSKFSLIDERYKSQQSKYQNDSERYEENFHDLQRVVDEHTSKLLLIDEMNEKQQHENQNASGRCERILQELNETITEHTNKFILIGEEREKQRSSYKNASISDVRALQDLNETVEKHDSRLLIIERRNENQQRVSQTTLQRYDSNLQDLRQLIQQLQSKVLNMTDELNTLRKDFSFFLGYQGSVINHGNTSYLVSKQKLSWADAWSFCRKIGAILVHIKNSSINAFLLKSLSQYGDNFWIGGELVSGSYKWKTSTGYQSISWANWAPGEPSSGSQKCINLWKYRGHKWDNEYCRIQSRFVCSREQV